IKVAEGVFGAMMLVEIYNDGPVTFMLESKSSNRELTRINANKN
ncbi:hypothetical protein DWB58_23755, partial [candidate division KSB1 bacterium]|nr:hypothetical protein [candidate division KSB1 bacterium]